MQTFDTPVPVSVELDLPAGRLRLIAADRADTTVEVLPADAGRSRDVKAAERTAVEYADGVLRIRAAATASRLLGPAGSVEVTVRLPAGSHVRATAAAADFRGVGRLGEVTLDGAQGAIKLDEAAAAHLTLLDGDITLGRLTGPAHITTDRGDLHITEAHRGPVTLRTHHGHITITAPRGTSATLDAGTTHGRIHNTLTHTASPTDLTIHATTTHGDITARSV
ncbi:DUF4097 family beta strand repeat-containing protein [Streptomyces sp. NPDC058662]|uniref:DUF4097 family beta strand repeat-containing protein n=1 Tax=Streptomyces sp. NPDC058662 TaxID=3346583 RepID=UPI00366A0F9F